MAMKTKTKVCLASAAAAAVGVAVGAYFGNQPASDASALLPMLGSFAVAFVSLVAALVLAPWGLLKGVFRGWQWTDGPSQETFYERHRRLFGDEPGMAPGVPSPGNVGHPLWEAYYGPRPGSIDSSR